MYSFKDHVFRTLLHSNAGSLQDTIKIQLGLAVLLALRRPLGHKLDGVHLRPPDLDTGEGHAGALDADRPLDDVQPRTGIHPAASRGRSSCWVWLRQATAGLSSPSWPVRPPYAVQPAVSADR